MKKPKESKFTTRQLEILYTWSQMNSMDQIADYLKISTHTIITHLKRMRKKIGVSRTVDVYIYAKSKNWLE